MIVPLDRALAETVIASGSPTSARGATLTRAALIEPASKPSISTNTNIEPAKAGPKAQNCGRITATIKPTGAAATINPTARVLGSTGT